MLSASVKPLTGSGDQAVLTAAQTSPRTSNNPIGVRTWPSAASITVRRGATRIAAREGENDQTLGREQGDDRKQDWDGHKNVGGAGSRSSQGAGHFKNARGEIDSRAQV